MKLTNRQKHELLKNWWEPYQSVIALREGAFDPFGYSEALEELPNFYKAQQIVNNLNLDQGIFEAIAGNPKQAYDIFDDQIKITLEDNMGYESFVYELVDKEGQQLATNPELSALVSSEVFFQEMVNTNSKVSREALRSEHSQLVSIVNEALSETQSFADEEPWWGDDDFIISDQDEMLQEALKLLVEEATPQIQEKQGPGEVSDNQRPLYIEQVNQYINNLLLHESSDRLQEFFPDVWETTRKIPRSKTYEQFLEENKLENFDYLDFYQNVIKEDEDWVKKNEISYFKGQGGSYAQEVYNGFVTTEWQVIKGQLAQGEGYKSEEAWHYAEKQAKEHTYDYPVEQTVPVYAGEYDEDTYNTYDDFLEEVRVQVEDTLKYPDPDYPYLPFDLDIDTEAFQKQMKEWATTLYDELDWQSPASRANEWNWREELQSYFEHRYPKLTDLMKDLIEIKTFSDLTDNQKENVLEYFEEAEPDDLIYVIKESIDAYTSRSLADVLSYWYSDQDLSSGFVEYLDEGQNVYDLLKQEKRPNEKYTVDEVLQYRSLLNFCADEGYFSKDKAEQLAGPEPVVLEAYQSLDSWNANYKNFDIAFDDLSPRLVEAYAKVHSNSTFDSVKYDFHDQLEEKFMDNYAVIKESLTRYYNENLSREDYRYNAEAQATFQLDEFPDKVFLVNADVENIEIYNLVHKGIDSDLEEKAEALYSLQARTDFLEQESQYFGIDEELIKVVESSKYDTEFVESVDAYLTNLQYIYETKSELLERDDLPLFVPTEVKELVQSHITDQDFVQRINDLESRKLLTAIDFEKFMTSNEWYKPIEQSMDALTFEQLQQVKAAQLTQMEGTITGLQQEIYNTIKGTNEVTDSNWEDVEYWVKDLHTEINNMRLIDSAIELKQPEQEMISEKKIEVSKDEPEFKL